MKLPRASVPIALASAVSLGAQVLFSLVMLRLFAPQAVGEFSVISQIAFFWMTLALAQSPIKLLADVHQAPVRALRAALSDSLLRLLLLLPLAWLGVQFSTLTETGQVLGWAALLALLQLGWYLAQPLTLRMASSRSTALGRALPPMVALAVAGLVGSLWPQAGSTSLLLAAGSGYAVGALWLLQARSAAVPGSAEAAVATPTAVQADSRSTALRLAHTAVAALTGVAIVLVWQRSHGAAEAGFLAVLLRVLGFVPTMIHAAWAQVLLAQGTRPVPHLFGSDWPVPWRHRCWGWLVLSPCRCSGWPRPGPGCCPSCCPSCCGRPVPACWRPAAICRFNAAEPAGFLKPPSALMRCNWWRCARHWCWAFHCPQPRMPGG